MTTGGNGEARGVRMVGFDWARVIACARVIADGRAAYLRGGLRAGVTEWLGGPGRGAGARGGW